MINKNINQIMTGSSGIFSLPAVTVYALNLIDLACTLYAISIGATELNPLMRCVSVLVVYKIVVVGALLWWLSRQRERAARYALYVATVVYGAVDVYHIINILC